MEKTSVKVLKSEPCKISLAFEIDKEKVREYLENIFGEIRQRAQIPGFRVGKAPMELIKKEFAKTANERMISKLSSEMIYDYLEKEKIKKAATPYITEISLEHDKNLTFNVVVERHPEIEVKNYKKIKITKKVKEITDADVDERLNLLRERNASLAPDPTGVVNDKSFAIIDYEIAVDGKKIENASAQNFLVDVSNPTNIKGLNEALIGAKINDNKSIEIAFPDEHPNREMAGKKGVMSFVVKDIKKKILPEIDDNFAKDIGVETLAKLKEMLKSSMVYERDKKVKEEMQKQVEESLLKSNQFDVPETITSDCQKSLLESIKNYFISNGMKEDEWQKNKETWEKKSREDAKNALRLSYIYDSIAKSEKIEVTDEDLNKTKESLKKLYEKNPTEFEKKWKENLSQVKYDILKEKVLKFIYDNAIISEDRG